MLNRVSIVDMVYLDFAKAFNKVDHGILLHKVKDLGIAGKLGQWFYHFLTNRKHFVRLPGGLSDDHPVISGVPQGTVLGPLLFIIMIADINSLSATGDRGRQSPLLPPLLGATRVDTIIHNYRLSAPP